MLLVASFVVHSNAGIHISSRQVVRDDYKVLRTNIKNHALVRGRVSFKERKIFLQFFHYLVYMCFECPPAIRLFCTVKFVSLYVKTSYVVLSEVKCLQSQFLVLDC